MSSEDTPREESDDDYPDQWQTHTVLSDGATVEVRPIRSSDRDALTAFHGRQSSESIYFRFFRHRPELSDRELDFFTQVDYHSRMAFVAFDGGTLVAVARYEGSSADPDNPTAEVAFFVDDEHHGRGLATLLLEYLAAAARANGFVAFTASVLPENYRMLGVFRAAGFETRTRFTDGVIEVSIDLTPTASALAIISQRLQQATNRSLQPMLDPEVVAIIGAGRRPGSLGHELLMSVRAAAGGEPSNVLAINPNTPELDGIPSFPSVAAAKDAIGTDINLAAIAVPADQVAGVTEDCGRSGVHGILVISSGFSEQGGVGLEQEQALVAAAHKHGMRVIGPNAFGVANTAWSAGGAGRHLNLLAVPIELRTGPVGLASDSGLLAAAVVEQFRLAGVGVSQIVGVGNQADVGIGDVVAFWALDEATRVVVLYSNRLHTERSSETRLAADAARTTSLVKPVVAVSPADEDSARLLTESGVILVDAVSELADQAMLFSCQPVPRGRRVVVVSNSASLARLATMACRRHDLEPVVPSSASMAARAAGIDAVLIDDLDQLSEIFGPTVAVSQGGSVADYERVIVASAVDQDVDALVLALLPTDAIPLEALGRLSDRVNRSVDKPVVVVGLYDRSGVDVENLPFYTFPEEAARALSRSATYGEWRQSIVDLVSSTDDSVWMPELLTTGVARHLTLVDGEIATVAERMGIPLIPYELATTSKEAEAAAQRLGYPVVLKLADGAVSVGESGGSAIDLHDRRSVRAAYQRMTELWGPSIETAVVQQHIDHQLLARLEVTNDDELGMALSLGLGGGAFDAVEPIDRTFLPMSGARLAEMVDSFRSGVGVGVMTDSSEAELAALVETVASLTTSHSVVRRLVLNPILIGPAGVVVANMELELATDSTDPLDDVRRL